MKETKLTLAMTAGVCALTVLAEQSISPLSMTIAAETHPLTTFVSTGTAIDTATSWNTGVPNTTMTTTGSSVDVSLQGTANIKVCFNSVRGVDTYGLDCEVFNVETGEVILQWNTADADTVLIEDLPYSFKSFDMNERGDIVYALRINNLPENVVFADTNSREPLEIFGKSVLGISGGANLCADVTLRNLDYVPDFHDTTDINGEVIPDVTDGSEDIIWFTTTTLPTVYTTATDKKGRLLDENGEVLIVNGTSAVMSGKAGQTTATTAPYQSITTYTTIKSSVDVSLQGTANIKVYFNSVRGVDTYGLDCEVFNVETGEVILQWNTADTDTVLIEDLPYSFKSFDLNERGDIVYALRINNLPENVVFADTNSREPLEIFGKSVLGISGGANLYADVTLRNLDYVPDFHDTTDINGKVIPAVTDGSEDIIWFSTTTLPTVYTTATDKDGRLLDENGEVLIDNGTSAVMSGKQGTGGGNIYRGDVNCKDGVDVSDAVLLARLIAEDSTVIVTEQGLKNADADRDGKLSSNDVITILRIIAKIPD